MKKRLLLLILVISLFLVLVSCDGAKDPEDPPAEPPAQEGNNPEENPGDGPDWDIADDLLGDNEDLGDLGGGQ